MASELKHPEWIWYGEDDEGNSRISFGRWAKHVCQMRYKLAEIQPTEHDHPTPVVPVSPDATGKCGELVTVKPLEWRRYRNGDAEAVTPFGEIYTAYVNGYWRITRNGKAGKFIKASGGDDVDAAKAGAQADFDANVLRLVRSQAVELLAAERAEKEKAQASRLYWKGKHQKLEADNAALTARVKAETELREDHQQRNKELEAKLAAAEKDAATWEANFKALNEKYARAALGGEAVMSQPSETEIQNAIEYAMRCHPVEEEHEGEDGAWIAEIYYATSLTPFVMCLLRELKVIS